MVVIKLLWLLAAFVLVTTATTSHLPNDIEDYTADEELDDDQLKPDEVENIAVSIWSFVFKSVSIHEVENLAESMQNGSKQTTMVS